MTTIQPLYERFRPSTWSDVVAQDKAIRQIELIARTNGGYSGQAWWISGQTGTGKTTIARLIAAEVASEWATVEDDSSAYDLARLREIDSECHYHGLGKGGRAYIVNEAHGLRAAQIRKLLCSWEPIPSHVVWILTTTCEGEAKLFEDYDDSSPLLGRCNVIRLARQGLCKPFARRLQTCLKAAGVDGENAPEWYERVLKDSGNSMRRAFDLALERLTQ